MNPLCFAYSAFDHANQARNSSSFSGLTDGN